MSLIKKFAVKTVKVEDLKEWEINPRIHSEKGLYDVKASISKFGMAALMYCDSDLTIIGGHARKKVLIELGVEEVKCWVAKKKLPEKEFKALALLSNQIFSSFNQQKVNEMTDPFSLLDRI
jgi:site-specific DNA-methyltransferase (adenine-specific)